ncbi:hypothetical protein [Motiliproteus sediminis]|uniref:hypothetical protein n=1 Tax=Motiliproteus sediminis TaxID=1468178 RepID=UPI001AF025D9|nr:hypothetical protein [Motiliproteus sediminis]
MNRLGWPALLLALALQGCSSEPEVAEVEEKAGMSGASREKAMHARWAGRDYKELIAELGKPIYEMTIPRYGWPNSSALLYGLDEGSGCIDAFLIVKGDDRTWVEDYYCR